MPSLLYETHKPSLFTKYLHRLIHLNIVVNQSDAIINPNFESFEKAVRLIFSNVDNSQETPEFLGQIYK